ncbi:MAG: DUF4956 domain-containing protein [Flavobacteriales bacterium]|nr:DUF4956 domain-containing protein [Flavobacteriales bacterium]
MKDIEFLGWKLVHEDFLELLFKFAIDLAVVYVLIRLIYYPIHKKKDFLFTYFLFNILIFFLCGLMNSVKLSMGFGFGLFAIFSILRYRTEQISIKDMTYLLAVIAIAVVNALLSKKVSLAELLFTNVVILLATYVLEHLWLTRHEAMRLVSYDKLELIQSNRREELMADLGKRLGIKVSRVEIGKIDMLRDLAQLRVFYFEDEQDLRTFSDMAPDGDD